MLVLGIVVGVLLVVGFVYREKVKTVVTDILAKFKKN